MRKEDRFHALRLPLGGTGGPPRLPVGIRRFQVRFHAVSQPGGPRGAVAARVSGSRARGVRDLRAVRNHAA